MQKNLNKMKKWADRNLVDYNRGKCKILHLGWTTAWRSGRGLPAENMGVLADSKLKGSHLYELAKYLNFCLHKLIIFKVLLADLSEKYKNISTSSSQI